MIYKPAQVGNNVLLNIVDVFLKEVIQKHHTIISVDRIITVKHLIIIFLALFPSCKIILAGSERMI
jgi:hypothetical protein